MPDCQPFIDSGSDCPSQAETNIRAKHGLTSEDNRDVVGRLWDHRGDGLRLLSSSKLHHGLALISAMY